MRAAWKHGVQAVLAARGRDHWFSTVDHLGRFSTGPTGCLSENLVEHNVVIAPSYTGVDYGEEGAVDWPQPARLRLEARCADCGCDVVEDYDIDDDLDVPELFALLELVGSARPADVPSFLRKLREFS